MKKLQTRWIALLTVCMLLLSAFGTALADETKLSAPAGVVINYGDNAASSEDDTISFEAVENADSYKVYVYQDGDTTAKVTTGTDTTIALAHPLDVGEYIVFVVAVSGDASSAASEKLSYTVEEEKKEQLGQVSDVKMDFSKVDPANSVYPTISFMGVENAGRYLVDIYKANESGEKQLTSLGYTTRLTIPAAQADGYMMDSTNYAALVPGYYVVAVTAYSNNSSYANGEPYEAFISWVNVDAIQPKAEATEPENGGIKVALGNYEDYNAGIDLIISIYADAACTSLVKQEKITYTTSESFGTVSYNCYSSFEVKDAADTKDGDLVVGTEYYAVVSLDEAVYTGAIASEPVAFTCTKAGDGKESSRGMGGMGGMGGGMSVTPTEATFAEGAETFQLVLGDNDLLKTTATLTEAAEGDKYTYTLKQGDEGAPFTLVMSLSLKEDGTTLLNVEGAGPISSTKKTGTWTVEDGNITLAW